MDRKETFCKKPPLQDGEIELIYLIYRNRKLGKCRGRGKCSKKKKKTEPKKSKQNKTKLEISKLLEKFKIMVIKILRELGRRVDEHKENFSKDKIKKKKTELKNTITEIKNAVKGISSRLDKADG